jgi:hypothetical protein
MARRPAHASDTSPSPWLSSRRSGEEKDQFEDREDQLKDDFE